MAEIHEKHSISTGVTLAGRSYQQQVLPKPANEYPYNSMSLTDIKINRKCLRLAAECLRPRGTVVLIGLPANAYAKAPVFPTVTNLRTIKGSYVGNRKETSEAIDFFRRGLINAPFKVVGLSELQKVYDLFRDGNVAGRYVADISK